MVLNDTGYEWHEVPKFMYYSLVVSFGAFAVWSPLYFTELPGVAVFFYVGVFSFAVSAVFAILMFPAYYFDGKKIRESKGADWEPDIRMYLLTSLLLTPYVVGGVYMVRRNRNVRNLDAGKRMM